MQCKVTAMGNSSSSGTHTRTPGRTLLLRTASLAVIASAIVITAPAQAQLAARRDATLSAPTIPNGSAPGQVRTRAQTDALDRQMANQTRADQIRTYATAALAVATHSVPHEV
jgi:hypothetical protein